MALTVVATPGSATANSYLTNAEADTYFEGHLYATDWTGASAATQDQALVMATRTIDALYEWAEWPASTTQALQWPRSGMMDHLFLSIIADTVIPQRLKDATAELAKALIAANVTAESQVEVQGLTSLSVGAIALTFKDSVVAKVIPDVVANLIPTWWGWIRTQSMSALLLNA
jgi:hypothetical protein